ncbi:MAG: molecular chaperone TorD family protein [Desulfurococcales archaeon]|nr:molecular chaperone TorD family protein [Desulfurococcales archaeon]
MLKGCLLLLSNASLRGAELIDGRPRGSKGGEAVCALPKCSNPPRVEVVEGWDLERVRLFIAKPGGPACPPYQSHYESPHGFLGDEHILTSLRSILDILGVELDKDREGFEDAAPAILEAISLSALLAASGDRRGINALRMLRDSHISWLPKMAVCIRTRSDHPTAQSLAMLLEWVADCVKNIV